MLGFRVWDLLDKRFIDCPYQIMNNKGELGMMDRTTFVPEPKRFTPMQSTGIKDCCNNMIFEGDVLVEGHNYVLVNNIIDFLMYLGTFDDVFEKGKLIMPIIGNIYSNPELLEELK